MHTGVVPHIRAQLTIKQGCAESYAITPFDDYTLIHTNRIPRGSCHHSFSCIIHLHWVKAKSFIIHIHCIELSRKCSIAYLVSNCMLYICNYSPVNSKFCMVRNLGYWFLISFYINSARLSELRYHYIVLIQMLEHC